MGTSIEEILENFEFLDDWEDRYKYLIDLGKALPELSSDEKADQNKVQGCVSQVWLITTTQAREDGTTILTFKGQSDALIVQGLVAIVIAIFSEKSAKEILNINISELFQNLQLQEHLSPQRSNGLKSMIGRIHADARAAIK